MVLSISAEPFGPFGGMAGDGAQKLLGTPPLTTLATLVRESVQNAWDARAGDQRVRFEVSLRQLEPGQAAVLRDQIFGDLPDATRSLAPLREGIAGERPMLLEIADYGTVGLGGPTRADVAVAEGQSRRFANFVRNIGSASSVAQGGGTYGFGKSSLFSASGCSTIIVDTLADDEGEQERRLIACHIGGEFDDAAGRRFTGRHWWGVSAEDGFVDPVTGDAAAHLASAIGLPERRSDGTGTTIAVVLPNLESVDAAVAEIREALLWYFWPKMIALDGVPAPMEFALFAEGREVIIPPPETFPPLDLYVEAYRAVKRKADASRIVRCGNPVAELGRMAVFKGFRNDRRLLAAETLVPEFSHHVALMRPVELVVKYLPGKQLGQGSLEWAGVFICSEVQEIERAFAASEPPAHDDWCPTNLSDRRRRTFVNVGLNKVKDIANRTIYPRLNLGATAPDQPPMARAASILGELMPVGAEDGVTGTKPVRGTRRRWAIQPALFVSIAEAGTAVDALFQVIVQNSSHEPLKVIAKPGLILDDRISEEVELPGGGLVTVAGWETADGVALSTGSNVEVGARETADLRVRIRIPGNQGAVGVRLSAED